MTAAERRPVRSLAALGLALARRWWPQVAALAAACGIVTAAIVGALGVGDALDRGLGQVAVARLGRIDAAVLGDDFFRGELAVEIAAQAARAGDAGVAVVPAIVMEVTVAGTRGGRPASARATLLACDDPAALGFSPAPPPLAADTVFLNDRLAGSIGATAGDAVVIRLPLVSEVPADSPLGRRTAESASRRVRVGSVIDAAGLGGFSLRPTQSTPLLVVTSLADAREILRKGDVANAIFAVPRAGGAVDVAGWLRERLRPTLADYGLGIEEIAGQAGLLRFTSRRLVIPPAADRAAAGAIPTFAGRPSLAFLANEMVPLDAAGRPTAARIPYSTVLGIDGTSLPVGDLEDDAGRRLAPPGDGEIIIDRWMADDLAAQGSPVAVGDRLAVVSFKPETIHGRVEEATAVFRISGIAAMRGAAIATSLVPDVEGITDEESIADWDPPFPFDQSRVRTSPPHDEDDRYWKQYGTTPKAFVSLAEARRIAGSRFGRTTAWHVPGSTPPDADIAARLAAQIAGGFSPEEVGLRIVPLRAEALAAARGSTPFGGLFLALSSFVVVAGLLLTWLLFGLLVAAHGRDVGLLAALGWPPRRLAWLLLAVGGLAAAAGVAGGMLVGPLWARLLVAVLGTAWQRDVAAGSSAVFAAARPGWAAAVIGGTLALALSLVALARAARRAGRLPPAALLKGGDEAALSVARRGSQGRRRPIGMIVGVVSLAAAVIAVAGSGAAGPQAAVGLFFTAGFAALVGLLALIRVWLAARSATPVGSLAALAGRTLAARPGRAFSTAAIVACGQFLIVAVSAFGLRPPARPDDRSSPTGGWTTIASLGEATSVDPADPATRPTLGLTAAEEAALARCAIARLRSSGGDDASCTNLYAAVRPTVLGVGPSFIDRGGFRFVAHAPLSTAADDAAGPWRLLDVAPADAGGPVPAVLDQATAQWGLKLGGVGSRFTLPDDVGQPAEFVIVGLLEPGILQGNVIIAERDFERIFPSRSGYRLALVDASALPEPERGSAATAVARAWADAGVSLEPAVDRLRGLQAVQNTFLAAFQALGTLGLLLGTAGVAAVQLQGVVERLGGLALLRAIGFTLARIRRLLMLETLASVGLGLAAGTGAAVLAVWPALAGGVARLPAGWIVVTAVTTLVIAAVAAWLATARATIPERPLLD
jgi:putative ABC transport system permease protein